MGIVGRYDVLVNSSNIDALGDYNGNRDYGFCPANPNEYGLVETREGSFEVIPKTPAYVLGEQLRLLADHVISVSGYVFSSTSSGIDRIITSAFNIFPGAAAEAVTEGAAAEEATQLVTEECGSVGTEQKFPPLKFYPDNFKTICHWINEKNILVLYTSQYCRIFHTISYDESDIETMLKNHRVIYHDTNGHPGLLADGEWEWSIKAAIKDVKELPYEDKLRDILIREILLDQRSVPHREYVSLGYRSLLHDSEG